MDVFWVFLHDMVGTCSNHPDYHSHQLGFAFSMLGKKFQTYSLKWCFFMVIYHCKKQQKHLQETNPIQGLVDNFIGNRKNVFEKTSLTSLDPIGIFTKQFFTIKINYTCR